MNTWSKNCPKCNGIQIYSSWDSLRGAIRKNTTCKPCKPKIDCWYRNCPSCVNQIVYKKYRNYWRANKLNRKCSDCTSLLRKKTQFKENYNIRLSENSKIKLRNSLTNIYKNPVMRNKISEKIKAVWKNPEIRKKYFDAMARTKWIKVRSDVGQLELLKKWNILGFNFEPNYQIHANGFLAYVDGYDKNKNIIIEFDSNYHNKQKQRKKDNIRQEKIINILHPKKFWRYNSISKTWNNVIKEK